MARIRSIKPEIRRSLVVSSWPYPVRWTFVGLPGYLDDEGRGQDDTRLIKSELYPLDDDMTSRKLEHHLTQIADNGPLCRYEVDGRRYLHITTWGEHQRVNRPSPSRIPPCPIHEKDVSPHGTITEGSLPRAQARAPAEQGAGKGAGSREQGAVSVERELRALTHPTETLDLLERTGPYVAIIRAELANHIDTLLTQPEITPTHIEPALREWQTRDRAAPGLLPGLVQDQLRRANGTAKPGRPSTTDTAVRASLARAAQLRAEEHA